MRINAQSRIDILCNSAGYFPSMPALIFVYFCGAMLGVAYLVEDHLPPNLVRPVAGIVAGVVIVLIVWLHVGYLVSRLGRDFLSIEGDTVTIRGLTRRDAGEVRCQVGELLAIKFGDELNTFELAMDRLHKLGVPRTGSIEFTKDFKAGKMLVVDRKGRRRVFHHVDKAFDPHLLLAFAAELRRRGVTIVAAD